jgi:prepilin-type processing-associated H-X9-DG protein
MSGFGAAGRFICMTLSSDNRLVSNVKGVISFLVLGRCTPAKREACPRAGARGRCGLTRIELLVVIGVIAITAAILLHALSGAKPKDGSTSCLNNLKQIQLAWQTYVADHEDKVPSNLAAPIAGVWRSAPDSWIGDSNARDDLDSSRIEHGAFYQGGYIRNLGLYQCPADETGRTRSYSLNANLGAPAWGQVVVRKAAEIPSPSRLFAFLDEHETSIDDGVFLLTRAPGEKWDNVPADRHGQGCNLSFADGHVEHWAWKAPKGAASAGSDGDKADVRTLQAVSLQPGQKPR